MKESGVIDKKDLTNSKVAMVYGQMNEPPGNRLRVALTGLTMAEYFREEKDESGRGKDVLRTITAADLFEVSAVTRPAYPEAQIEARNWSPVRTLPTGRALGADFRWRR